MVTVFVQLDVLPDKIDPFLDGIRKNARASLADEPGCVRFDVLRDAQVPTRFYFYEIYLDEDAFFVAHRSAPHYAAWLKVEAECIVPGSKSNLLAVPQFPGDIPEFSAPREKTTDDD